MEKKQKDMLDGFGLLLDIEGELVASLPMIPSKSRLGSFEKEIEEIKGLIWERVLWRKTPGKKLVDELIHLNAKMDELTGRVRQEERIESALGMVRTLLAPMREENKRRQEGPKCLAVEEKHGA